MRLVWIKATFLLAFAALVAGKIPSVLDGRLWAEDGFFLADALRLPIGQALLTQHTGYIDVVASGLMLFATRLVDLESVPFVAVLGALVVQCLPALLLLTSGCAWLRSRWLLALLLLLAPPLVEEIWLSPVTSQYHLMVCTGLILALPIRPGAIGLLRLLLVAIAGLTGPGPALLAPLFILRALIDRSWMRGLQAGLLCAGAGFEAFLILVRYPEPTRHFLIGPELLLDVVWFKHVLIPLFGRDMALLLWSRFNHWLPMVGALGMLLGLMVASLRSRAVEVRWLLAGSLMLMVCSYIGALGPKANLLGAYYGNRYYYAPQVLLGLTVLGISVTARETLIRLAAGVMVGWLLLVGAADYRLINPAMAVGPSWRAQIAEWRANPAMRVKLWPPTFTVSLSTN